MLRDLKYALRQLRKNKRIAGAVVASLGLCIGMNALIFSMLYTLVLQPPPFTHSGQLIEVSNSYPKLGRPNDQGTVTQYLDYAKHPEVFSDVGLFLQTGLTMGDSSGPIRTDLARVTPSFFDMLGVKPVLGRFFGPETTAPANSYYVVLAYPFWKAHFNSDPEVIGRTVTLGEVPCVITGVAPASVQYFEPHATVYIPQAWLPQDLDDLSRHSRAYALTGRLFARIRPGLSIAQAATLVSAIDRSYYDAGSARYRHYVDLSGYQSIVRPIQDRQTSVRKGVLYLLECGALLVLLIGCVNMVNLLLARATSRQSELAIRHALGGSRWHIVRQLLSESLLLAFLGGLLGTGLSVVGLGVVNHYASDLLGPGTEVRIDPVLFIAAFGIAALVGLLTGILPGIRAVRSNLLAGIQQNSRSASSGRRSRLFGAVLASGQIALSLVLLVASGLLVRSMAKALAVPPGFDADQVTTARIALPMSIFNDKQAVFRLQAQIVESLDRIPGVEAVGMATYTPTVDISGSTEVAIHGEGSATEIVHHLADFFTVSPGYFPAMGIRVISGRAFDARDNAATSNSVLVDRQFAERYFPGQDAVGRRVASYPMSGDHTAWATIIGVVETVRYAGLDDVKGTPFVYIPIQRAPHPGTSFFIRSHRSADDLVPIIRQRILAIIPTVPVYETGSMKSFVDATLNWREALLVLLGAFAVTALVLSSVGIYGVLAYDVSQRVREIGIRGAIGGSRGQILTLILFQGLRTIGFGMAAGLVGSLWLGQLMASKLFQVSPSDPFTLGAISVILLLVGLVASLLPAWRAAKIDPVVALRAE